MREIFRKCLLLAALPLLSTVLAADDYPDGMLDRAAGRDFNQKDTLSLLITAWNRWMRQSVGEAIPLDDLETDLIF